MHKRDSYGFRKMDLGGFARMCMDLLGFVRVRQAWEGFVKVHKNLQ